MWRGIDHELEALLGRWQLRDILLWMSSSDMLLHRPVSLFLRVQIPRYHECPVYKTAKHEFQFQFQRGAEQTQQSRAETLTPRQRLRQLEPS